MGSGLGFVAGRATSEAARLLDVVLAIDTSDSTEMPSGVDIDGDGVVGTERTTRPVSSDEGDTVLAAEVAASRALITQLDPRTTRVGVVSFAGDNDPMTPDAVAAVPLTSDFAEADAGLAKLQRKGPLGMTNMVSAINTSTIELIGTESARSEKRAGARRVMVFLTDGQPTLPIEKAQLQNAKMTVQQAVRSARFGIRIDTFVFGEEGLAEQVVAKEMARVTNGVFTPVADLATLTDALGKANFSGVERLEIANRTTDQAAIQVLRRPDGFFAALVPLRDGENAIGLRAHLESGPDGELSVGVQVSASSADGVPPSLAATRESLLGAARAAGAKEPAAP